MARQQTLMYPQTVSLWMPKGAVFITNSNKIVRLDELNDSWQLRERHLIGSLFLHQAVIF